MGPAFQEALAFPLRLVADSEEEGLLAFPLHPVADSEEEALLVVEVEPGL